jgi:predicted type IV restriction endonuclease
MQPESTSKIVETQSTETTQSLTESTDSIVTTEEEWEGYYFVKAILHDIVDPSKIVMRDAKSYCDRRSISRLYLDGKQKYV